MKSLRLPSLCRIKNKWICLLLCLLLTGCNNHTVYHSYQPVSTTGWNKDDTLIYALPPSIPAGTYEIEIGIRHYEEYPYRNLWLGFSQNMQDTLVYTTDSLQLFLADETGHWNGNSPGGLYQLTQMYKPNFIIVQEGYSRTIRIIHLMKDKPLKGISDIGICLRQKTIP